MSGQRHLRTRRRIYHARVTDGSLFAHPLTAIAGVTNIGDDINWCGHPFAQANWYAFGRLAWKHSLSSEEIGEEWLKQTFLPIAGQPSHNSVNETSQKERQELHSQLSLLNSQLLQESREAVVDYMMPLGLHHIFAWGHHYGPEPWCDIPGARPDWMPSYYHRQMTAVSDSTAAAKGAMRRHNITLLCANNWMT